MTFQNEVSFSTSKQKMLGRCARMYWYHCYVAWEGWWRGSKPPKDARAEEAYTLKFEENVSVWIGKLVHRAAEMGLSMAKDKIHWTSREHHVNLVLRKLRMEFDSKIETLNHKGNPKRRLILREVQSGQTIDPEKIWTEVVERVNVLMGGDELWEGASRNLYFRAADQPRKIIMTETLGEREYRGIKVWTTMDLMVRAKEDGRGAVIIDWKTGKESKLEHGMQLIHYAAWAITKGWDDLSLMMIYIGDTKVLVRKGRTDQDALARSNEFVDLFLEELRARLVNGDIHRNEPKEEDFEPTTDVSVCRYCAFASMCERDGAKP